MSNPTSRALALIAVDVSTIDPGGLEARARDSGPESPAQARGPGKKHENQDPGPEPRVPSQELRLRHPLPDHVWKNPAVPKRHQLLGRVDADGHGERAHGAVDGRCA